jgi:hypothetical protein
MYNRVLNVDALPDLLSACRNALGAYEALKLVGADNYLPGYESCLRDLKAAIAKAESTPNNASARPAFGSVQGVRRGNDG